MRRLRDQCNGAVEQLLQGMVAKMPTLQDAGEWENTKKRFTAWWHGEMLDRPLLQIFVPVPPRTGEKPPAQPPDPVQRWTDMNYIEEATEWAFMHTRFLGDAFHYGVASLGPGSLAIHLGSRPIFAPETVWYEPCLKSLDEPIRFDPEEKWWQWTKELTARLMRRARGRYLVAIPDLIEHLDILASLRGTQQLLMDLADEPQNIIPREEEILAAWWRCFDELYDIVSPERDGNCFIAFNIWGPGKTAKVQCDFAAMISAKMFEQFEAPMLQKQCDALDFSLFHLDGPMCVQHLDILLEIRSLNAIQWQPGAGAPNAGSECWFPMYKKILKSGKGLQIGLLIDRVEAVVKEVGPRGLMLMTWADSEEEANDLLRRAQYWKQP